MFTPTEFSFPHITHFPELSFDSEIAIVIRIFPKHDEITDKDDDTLNIAAWSVRSHLLNSDITEYQAQPVFHVKEMFYSRAHMFFSDLGIPDECIVSYSNDLCHLNTPHRSYHYNAAAPLLDTTLHKFEHIIVLDADTFAIRPPGASPLPLVDLSLNKYAVDTFTTARAWRAGVPLDPMWLDFHENNWKRFVEHACRWVECSAAEFDSVMRDPEGIKPFFNGGYINLPMRWLREDVEFREFIHDCSADLGHEEVALAMWALRHYFRTGERIPTHCLFESGIPIAWDFPPLWDKYNNLMKTIFFHARTIEGVTPHIHAFMRALGATQDEIVTATANIVQG